jgi:hypothetical protein
VSSRRGAGRARDGDGTAEQPSQPSHVRRDVLAPKLPANDVGERGGEAAIPLPASAADRSPHTVPEDVRRRVIELLADILIADLTDYPP